MTGLTRKQAAELAGVSEHTINGWTVNGYLRAALPTRTQHFTAADVLAAKQLAHAGDVVPRWREDQVRAGKRLRALRERAGLTQLELSARAGITHEALSNIELGKRVALASTVHQLSAALGIPPERFVDDTLLSLEMLTTQDVGRQLDVPVARIQVWLKQGVLPGVKVSGQWRVPAIAVAELERSGRLRGRSRRLDPRYRG